AQQVMAVVGVQATVTRILVRRAGAVGFAAACLVLLSLVVTGPNGADPAPGGSEVTAQTVHATDRAFDRPDVEVAVGSTVEWANVGDDDHLLVRTMGGATVRTPLAPGENQDVTFEQ